MFKQVHKNILKWYEENGRHELPWRHTANPYNIYISEIMLQQTQVKTVLERFYFPFLEAFPTVEDLANAGLDEVLKKWEGLGYYRRARHLHEAAKLVSPHMPKSVKELMQMKGVGQSTAHAVACFAYKTPLPILDANVKRILYRVFAIKKANEKELWKMAYAFFDAKNPYEFNQALMDIGSSICVKTAKCEICPIQSSCLAADLNPQDFPSKKVKKIVPVREKNLFLYTYNKKLGLVQRGGDFLHGLWGLREEDDVKESSVFHGSFVHKYSHFHLHAKVYTYEGFQKELKYVSWESINDLALSTADHKALKLIKPLS